MQLKALIFEKKFFYNIVVRIIYLKSFIFLFGDDRTINFALILNTFIQYFILISVK